MRPRTRWLALVAAAVVSFGCRDGKPDPRDLLKDTALAQDLKEVAADTAAYVDAADVAMTDLPDSTLAPATSRQPTSRTAKQPTMRVPDRPAPMAPPPNANDVTPSIPLDAPRATACESPARADQRRCLMTFLARSDAGLDRTYQELIAALRGDPASVRQLRTAQRAWLVYRDSECRRRNRGQEGPLWAPTRAQCLGEFSSQREEELRQQISRLPAR